MRPFSAALSDGHAGESLWVEHMKSHGLSVANGKKHVAKNFDHAVDRTQHPDAAAVVRVEIKTRSLKFTCPEDYPYPTAFLANVSKEDRDVTQPMIYVLRSGPTGAFVWVMATDEDDTWTRTYKTDTTRNSRVLMLECPSSCLRHADDIGKYILHHKVLELVDGRVDAFAANPAARGTGGGSDKRKRGIEKETAECLGRGLKKSKQKCSPCGKRSKPCGR